MNCPHCLTGGTKAKHKTKQKSPQVTTSGGWVSRAMGQTTSRFSKLQRLRASGAQEFTPGPRGTAPGSRQHPAPLLRLQPSGNSKPSPTLTQRNQLAAHSCAASSCTRRTRNSAITATSRQQGRQRLETLHCTAVSKKSWHVPVH